MWWLLLLVGLLGIAYVYWKNTSRPSGFRGMGFKVQHAPRELESVADNWQAPRSVEKPSQVPQARKATLFQEAVQESLPVEEKSRVRASLSSLLKDAQQALDENDDNRAVDLFNKILTIDDAHLEANQRLGLIYLQQGVASKAAVLFKVLTKIESGNASNFSNLGYAFFMQNRLQEAREAYEAALALDSSRAGRFASLAQVYMAMQKYEEALELLKKSLDMEPQNVDFLLLMADNYRSLSRKAEAIQSLEAILQMDPGHSAAREWLESLN